VESEPDPKHPGQTKTTRFRWITNRRYRKLGDRCL
jgi:hypothetical protein